MTFGNALQIARCRLGRRTTSRCLDHTNLLRRALAAPNLVKMTCIAAQQLPDRTAGAAALALQWRRPADCDVAAIFEACNLALQGHGADSEHWSAGGTCMCISAMCNQSIGGPQSLHQVSIAPRSPVAAVAAVAAALHA